MGTLNILFQIFQINGFIHICSKLSEINKIPNLKFFKAKQLSDVCDIQT